MPEGTIDFDRDTQIDQFLRSVSSLGEIPTEDIPPLPATLRAELERATISEGVEDTVEADSTIYSIPRRFREGAPKSSARPRTGITSMVFWTAGLAAAAAVAILATTKLRSKPQVEVPIANAATVLTPGEVTGFTEPIFTWETDNGGVVDVMIVDRETGDTIATLSQAFSPLRFQAMAKNEPLRPNASYAIRLMASERQLGERIFNTGENAKGAPLPAGDVDAIVRQCESLLAERRAADAWMLWSELTVTEKSDPRMQELRTRILALLAA